jgi:hypothetical protein
MRGYEQANNIALDLWEEVYPKGQTLLALTDTFSTKAFFQVRACDRFPPTAHLSAPLKFPLVRRCIAFGE